MTAVVHSQWRWKGVTYSIDIRSLNHRYLDIRLRLPFALQTWELEIRKFIEANIARGSLDITITRDKADDQSHLRLNTELIDELNRLYKALEAQNPDDRPFNWRDLLSHREIFKEESNKTIDLDQAQPSFQRAFKRTLNELKRMRKQEGDELKKFFNQSVKQIEALHKGFVKLADKRADKRRKRLQQKVAGLIKQQGADVDKDRLHQEVILWVERGDITEELVRLQSHCKQFRKFLNLREPAGRKLEFLIQEMGREANTVGSKSNDTDLAYAAMDLKSLLEKLREQVQNIE